MALLHTVILAKLGGIGIPGYQACGGKKTFASFSPFTAKPASRMRAKIVSHPHT
jgi:hypothetical protein